MEGGEYQRILLNFDNVRYMSSTALGMLIGLKKKADAAGVRLMLCCLAPHLVNLSQLAHLGRLIQISESQREALRAF